MNSAQQNKVLSLLPSILLINECGAAGPLVSHDMEWCILAGIPVSSCWLTWLTPLLPKHLLLVGFISEDVGKLTSHLSLLDLSLAYSVSGLAQYETMLPSANFHTFDSMNFAFLDTLICMLSLQR